MKLRHLKYIFILLIMLSLYEAKGQSSLGYVEGDVIIRFKETDDPAIRQSLSGDLDVLTLQGVSRSVQLSLSSAFNNFDVQHYQGVGGTQTTQEIIEQIQDHPAVEYIEPNYLISKTDISSQSFNNPDRIFARKAWSALQKSNATPITIAVLDTGIEVTHRDLSNVVWENRNEIPNDGIDNDGNGFIDDIHGWNFVDRNGDLSDCDGHGTHVSGIIEQTTTIDDSTSTNTSSPIRIMGLKFLGCDGIGSTAHAISAIDYAIDHGAKVLNNSWGNDSYSNALHEAVIRSYNAETVFVAAAGNNGSNNDVTPFYPASFSIPHVISVAATDFNDNFAVAFSNYGLRSVALTAPGVAVQSAYPNNQDNVRLSGTSQSTPFVSAVLGLMFWQQPLLNGYQAKQLLLDAADELSVLSDIVDQGRRLNALRSILAAQNMREPSSYMPEYASQTFSSKTSGGCGLVYKMYSDLNKIQSGKNQQQKGRGGHLPKALFGLMLVLPLMVWTFLKQKALHSNKRKYERYEVDMPMHLSIEGHFVPAHLFSISQGGAGISVSKALQTQLKKGSHIDVLLSSHNENVQISGRIVWMSNDQIGVQFKQEATWIKELFAVWHLEVAKENSKSNHRSTL